MTKSQEAVAIIQIWNLYSIMLTFHLAQHFHFLHNSNIAMISLSSSSIITTGDLNDFSNTTLTTVLADYWCKKKKLKATTLNCWYKMALK